MFENRKQPDTPSSDEGDFEQYLRSTAPNVTPSPEFKQRLLTQLLDKVDSQQAHSTKGSSRSWKYTWAFRISSATAACLIISLTFWMLSGDSVRGASGRNANTTPPS